MAVVMKLAPREAQLAQLVVAGYSNKEIAPLMGITENTAKIYLSHIYERLQLQGWGSSRVRLVQIMLGYQGPEIPSASGYDFPLGV